MVANTEDRRWNAGWSRAGYRPAWCDDQLDLAGT